MKESTLGEFAKRKFQRRKREDGVERNRLTKKKQERKDSQRPVTGYGCRGGDTKDEQDTAGEGSCH